MIKEITAPTVVEIAKNNLSLPRNSSIDEILLGGLTRRAASVHCPCPRSIIINAVVKPLRSLVDNVDEINETIYNVIDKLVVIGDLLEMKDVIVNEGNLNSTWLFLAPPSFFRMNDGSLLVQGTTRGENFAAEQFVDRIIYKGVKRIIQPMDNEGLAEQLLGLGFIEQSEERLMKLPKKVSAKQLINQIDQLLDNAQLTTPIDGLTILDGEFARYYRNRWSSVRGQSGRFIAKRPHIYGHEWCYAELKDGTLKRFIDLPNVINGKAQRSCDTAWHLQMALDDKKGRPQTYRVKKVGPMIQFEFFNPIPFWAERRLMVMGEESTGTDCLFSYAIDVNHAASEQVFLNDYLWISPSHS